METISFEIHSSLAEKINNYIKLFGNKDLFFDKFIEFNIKKLKKEIIQMQIDLNKFEQKYKMDSSLFFEKFEKGELDDEKDYILWSGIYEMQLNCKQKLQ
jgi:hypothetical protein